MVQAVHSHSTRAPRIQGAVPQILSTIAELNRAMAEAPDAETRRLFRRVERLERSLSVTPARTLGEVIDKAEHAMDLTEGGYCPLALDVLTSAVADLRRLAGAGVHA